MTGTKKCANFGGKCHRPPLKRNKVNRLMRCFLNPHGQLHTLRVYLNGGNCREMLYLITLPITAVLDFPIRSL